MARSVPTTRNVPSANSISPTSASDRCAMPRRPFSMAWSQASTVALPAIMIEREATLGVPAGTSSLSPSTSRTAPGSTPSRLAISGTNVERCPCPIACAPVRNATLPSCSKRRSTASSRIPPATSRKQPMPMPRSLPSRSDAARRAAKPFQSASASARSRMVAKSPLS